MTERDAILSDVIALPLLGAAVLFVLWRCRLLSGRFLAAGPRRPVVLLVEDAMIAVMLIFFAWSAASVAVSIFLAGGTLSTRSPMDHAIVVVIGQGAMVPLVGYVIWRVATQKDGLSHFGLRPERPFRDLGLAVVALLAALPMTYGAGVIVALISVTWVEPLPEVGHPVLDAVGRADASMTVIAVLVFGAVIAAPLIEEIVYRGLFQTVLLAQDGVSHRWSVILIASVVFTLVHATLPWQVLPQLFVLSLLLGWLYERTGSLWPSILVHVLFNAFSFVMLGFDSGHSRS
ncbi:MAG: hypothetical protein CMJ18_06565 [Phycisphaeraceae bacterium]|nr:hypothetical protein [Phycisphaeraceae bacterium]